MNRKTFLSSLLALITAPFLVKSKEKEPDLEAWIKANPELYKQIVANALQRTGKAAIDAGNAMVNLSGKLTVSGNDLRMVLNRKR